MKYLYVSLQLYFLFFTLTSCDETNAPVVFDLKVEVNPPTGGVIIPATELRVIKDQLLSLLAIPNAGYTFSGWEGNLSSAENPVSVTVSEHLNVTANFTLKTYPLEVATIGSGTVVETIVANKVTEYDHGTQVQLLAVASEKWVFDRWEGALTGVENPQIISITDSTYVTAVFEYDILGPEPVVKTNDTKIYMHYMPWYTSGPHDGSWSTHWTMNNRNPEIISNGKRQIASHFYPLIGPYSSQDPDLVEYHLLLMKYIGVDAVLIDWYGTYDVYDYRDNLRGSNALIDLADDVGLQFGIVYEDRTTAAVVDFGQAPTKVAAATTDFQYIFDQYFSNNNYLTVGGIPVAAVFTPIEIETGSSWNTILANAPANPLFLSIWGERNDLGNEGDGEYAWVYNGNGNHDELLRNFYDRIGSMTLGIGSAYPGFKDFYEEGGQGNIIGWEIAHNGTETLDLTIGIADAFGVEHLQFVTWNDFGEGTMLEPTLEYGYDFLTTIQEFTGVEYSNTELELIYKLYMLRKQFASDEGIQKQLTQAFYLLSALEVNEAAKIINGLPDN